MHFILRIAFVVFPAFIISSCSLRNGDDNVNTVKYENQIEDGREKHANIQFEEDFVDLGTIKHGEVISYTFKFINSGNIPLIISDVNAGCGCTRTKLSKKLVRPNEPATLVVVFDSKGWFGSQFKSATIVSNALTQKRSVTIKVNVVK
jgi:hypothetical protein